MRLITYIALPTIVFKFVALLIGVPLGAAENETAKIIAVVAGLIAALVTWAWMWRTGFLWNR